MRFFTRSWPIRAPAETGNISEDSGRDRFSRPFPFINKHVCGIFICRPPA